MSEQFFAMQLEDHSLPEMLHFLKTYYGTLNQIGEFIAHLAAEIQIQQSSMLQLSGLMKITETAIWVLFI